MTQPLYASAAASGERFASAVGIRIDDDGAPPCGARATLDPSAGADDPVPTGALLALVDAVARRGAAEATHDAPEPLRLEIVAASVQFRSPAVGRLTATATTPCEGTVADRAGPDGGFRFSVAVDVVDGAGTRVASASVQWRAAPNGAGTNGTG
jgi:hypothetical protein